MKFGEIPKGAPLPKENELPLSIRESKKISSHGDSIAWQVAAQTTEGREKMIALKQVKSEDFASPEQMRADKKF